MSSRIVYGALPGETLLNRANRSVVSELAAALFNEPQTKHGLFCSGCGGETFRFYAGSKVRCMLCSESGELVVDGDKMRIEMVSNEHQFMANETEALRHRDWLLGMVGRFKDQKEVLTKVRSGYEDNMLWISPKKDASES